MRSPDSVMLAARRHGGFPKLGYHFGGPHNKDHSILGSILGSPYFGKLPHDTVDGGNLAPPA